MNYADSREEILAKMKINKPKTRPLPDIPTFEVAGDPLQNFQQKLKGFDGESYIFSSRQEAIDWLKANVLTRQGQIFSAAEGVEGNVGLGDFKSQAEMHTIDICIAEAILGIGETGSLLVDANSLGAPAAALFSTDLYLLIDRSKIYSSVQEVYLKVDMAQYQYSSFFSGPSATADIEAVHITGAQGEISLTALIY